jgi:hypothetical protein
MLAANSFTSSKQLGKFILKDDLAAIGSSAAAFRLLGKQAGFGSSRGLRSPENQRANCQNYFYDVKR